MYDYLIIGHGLAGALLSQNLIDRGYQVLVVDDTERNNSSMIAAGLYNPITGRKMVKTWMADQLFPLIEPTYRSLEEKLGLQFLHPIGIYRPFYSIEEKNDWQGRSSDEKFKPYIFKITEGPSEELSVRDPYGGIHLQQAGYVDIPVFLQGNVQFLTERNAYIEAHFKENELAINENSVEWNNHKFKKVIFCNGVAARETRLFEWLPFTPVKGQLFDGMMGPKCSTIYNRGVFVVPLGDEAVRVGATYQNHFDHMNPDERGLQELQDKLAGLVEENIKVTKQKAGIRPATKDRRPFIGKHPEYEHIYVFNGFGSKGVSLIPFFSNHFVEYLEGKMSLDENVDVQRCASFDDRKIG